MADDGFILTRRATERIAETVRRTLGALPRVPQVKRRVFDGADDQSDTSAGASCGCCDPTNCADYLQATQNDDDCPESPFGWEVNFGSALDLTLLCSGLPADGDGNFELLYVDYGVWRSETFTCQDEATTGGCNTTTSGCCGEAVDEYDWDGDSYALTGPTNCTGNCASTSPGWTEDRGPVNQPCRPTSGDLSEYVWISNDGATWEVTANACASEPPEPPRAPLFSGDTYPNSCCNTASTGPGGATDQYAYIQLTIDNTRDSDGRSNTRLELIVGGVAAFTYRPRVGFDWCCSCENKLELQCCGPWAFRYLPESICVKPADPTQLDGRYVDAPEGWSCCAPYFTEGDEEIPKLPRYVMIDIAASEDACPSGTCCSQASGQFVLEWYEAGGYWEYTFPPACDGTTAAFPMVPACNDVVCSPTIGSFGPDLWLWQWRLTCDTAGSDAVFVLTLYVANIEPVDTPECDPPTCNEDGCFQSEVIPVNVVSGLRDPEEQCFATVKTLSTSSGTQLCEITAATAVALL